ncbi:MAG: pilus assembly protein [Anaerolineae bacterium]|nr:pilus assembly protein [Anaerolineae bacterium]
MNLYRKTKTGIGLGRGKRARRGQSLVEFALTLPVLLTILAGVVEVANILAVYNRAQMASREGTRFGAQGGTNAGIMTVVEQSSTDSLMATEEQMQVWVIRPVILASGSPAALSWAAPTTIAAWGAADVECVFPTTGCDDPVDPPLTPAQVLGDVQAIAGDNAAAFNNTRFVITVVRYDADMILRLPWFSPPDTGGRFRMWTYTIMRQEVEQTAISLKVGGCSAYSVALSKQAIEAAGINANTTNPMDIGKEFTVTRNDEYAGQREGFAFLGWNWEHLGHEDFTSGPSTAQGSFEFPGNSVACDAAGIPFAYSEYDVSPPDTSMHRGDWVLLNPDVNMSHAMDELVSTGGHADLERHLRIIIYDYKPDGTLPYPNPRLHVGGPLTQAWEYQIYGFAKIVLVQDGSCKGGTAGCPTDQMTFQWQGVDLSCGFEE